MFSLIHLALFHFATDLFFCQTLPQGQLLYPRTLFLRPAGAAGIRLSLGMGQELVCPNDLDGYNRSDRKLLKEPRYLDDHLGKIHLRKSGRIRVPGFLRPESSRNRREFQMARTKIVNQLGNQIVIFCNAVFNLHSQDGVGQSFAWACGCKVECGRLLGVVGDSWNKN